MKKYLLILAIVLIPYMLRAQSLEKHESVLMNERLLDLIDDYERYSSFGNKSDASSFLALFFAPNAKVWCDYVSSEYFGRMVNVRDYVEMTKDMEYHSVRISNLSKHDFFYANHDWHTTIEFDKSIDYEDGLGFTFTTRSDMAGGDYHIAMDCVWLPKESVFRIEKISGAVKNQSDFQSGLFRVVKHQESLDSKLLYDGKPLKYNEYGFAVLPNRGEFTINDDDFRLQQEVVPGHGRYDVYSFAADPKLFRVRPRMSFLINPVTVKTVYGSDFQPASVGIEAAADFGVALRISDDIKYVPYIGVGIAHSWVDLRSRALLGGHRAAYTYNDRYYKFKATETFSFDDFVVSLSPASFEYRFDNGLVAALEAGFKVYTNIVATDIYSITFTNPTDAHLIHGFRNVEELPLSTDKGLNHYWIASVFAKGGLDFSFKESSLLFVHLGIENGMGSYSGTFKNVIYNNPNPTPWLDDEAGIYPVVYRMNGSTLEDIKDHTFKSSIKSVRRRLSGIIEFGYVYKF